MLRHAGRTFMSFFGDTMLEDFWDNSKPFLNWRRTSLLSLECVFLMGKATHVIIYHNFECFFFQAAQILDEKMSFFFLIEIQGIATGPMGRFGVMLLEACDYVYSDSLQSLGKAARSYLPKNTRSI